MGIIKTLIACKCGTLVALSKEPSPHYFDPDAEYDVWKNYHLAKTCNQCHVVFDYFVSGNKSNPPEAFQTFKRECVDGN